MHIDENNRTVQHRTGEQQNHFPTHTKYLQQNIQTSVIVSWHKNTDM